MGVTTSTANFLSPVRAVARPAAAKAMGSFMGPSKALVPVSVSGINGISRSQMASNNAAKVTRGLQPTPFTPAGQQRAAGPAGIPLTPFKPPPNWPAKLAALLSRFDMTKMGSQMGLLRGLLPSFLDEMEKISQSSRPRRFIGV